MSLGEKVFSAWMLITLCAGILGPLIFEDDWHKLFDEE